SRAGSCCALRSPRRLKVEAVSELAEDVDEPLDLRLGVGCRDLDPEADLTPRNQWVGRERHVDPVLEQEAPHGANVLPVGERDLDDGEARRVRRVRAETVEALEHGGGLAPERGTDRLSPLLVHVEAGEDRRERRDGRGAGVEIRRGGGFQQKLELAGAGDERGERGVRLREPGDEEDVVVRLAEMPDDAVAARAIWTQLV